MKTLVASRKQFKAAGRWDIDFHLPAEGIKKFPSVLLKRVDQVADVAKDKRDPTKTPDSVFRYIDISSIEISTGTIANAQDVEGNEAPSRARKVVGAFDIIVSTCRPTRGAVAVVPIRLHNQIASTAFSILRVHEDVNPFYLHYALRLPSTLEQFRKWSTGSSYPAILDSDVEKTLIPVPSIDEQDAIAAKIVEASRKRSMAIRSVNSDWSRIIGDITAGLRGDGPNGTSDLTEYPEDDDPLLIADIRTALLDLPQLNVINKAKVKTHRRQVRRRAVHPSLF